MEILLSLLFQIMRVCRTDCVKVQNLKENAEDYSIKVALMNKRLTSGLITAIKRCESNSKTAYVHYASYKGT